MGRIKNMAGVKLTHCHVIRYVGSNSDKKATWECVCSCGNVFVAAGKHLRNGDIKSCGCLKMFALKNSGKNNKTHGETKTRLYSIWHGMKKRCYTLSDTSYKNYGLKGITVCDEWFKSYENFRDWSLENGYEDTLTIDRIDFRGNYEPLNCRWATMKEQENNRSNNVKVIFKGVLKTLSQVAEEIGESRAMIGYRHKNGIDFETQKRQFKESDLKGVNDEITNG